MMGAHRRRSVPNRGRARALVPLDGTGLTMSRVLILRALLAVAVSLSLISNAEARRWRLWPLHVFFGHGYSVHSSDQDRPARIDTALEMARARSQGGAAFGAAIHQVLRGCLEQ